MCSVLGPGFVDLTIPAILTDCYCESLEQHRILTVTTTNGKTFKMDGIFVVGRFRNLPCGYLVPSRGASSLSTASGLLGRTTFDLGWHLQEMLFLPVTFMRLRFPCVGSVPRLAADIRMSDDRKRWQHLQKYPKAVVAYGEIGRAALEPVYPDEIVRRKRVGVGKEGKKSRKRKRWQR